MISNCDNSLTLNKPLVQKCPIATDDDDSHRKGLKDLLEGLERPYSGSERFHKELAEPQVGKHDHQKGLKGEKEVIEKNSQQFPMLC